MELEQVADELYRLVPTEFRPARDERVKQARAEGDRELAAAIAKLRRPTVSAWVVNRLAHEARDELGRLVELGEALREAQRTLAGETIRDLSRQRRSQLNGLIQHARRLVRAAGQSITAQVEREVAASLEAAVADPGAAAAILSGRLTTALYHVGLGSEEPGLIVFGSDPGAASGKGGAGEDRKGRAEPAGGEKPARRLRAVPDAGGTARAGASQPKRGPAGTRQAAGGSGGGRRSATPKQTPEEAEAERTARLAEMAAQQAAREEAAAQRKAREVAAAENDLREAETLAAEAGTVLVDAERRVATARATRKSVQSTLEQLERQLVAAQTEDAKAARELRDSQRSREAALGSLSTAKRRVQRAKTKLEKLS
jgi:hypothetical protein